MNSKGIEALTGERTKVCMKCLKKDATNFYRIAGRGYGSIYDNTDTRFQLCDDCAEEKYREWVNEKPKECSEEFSAEEYEHENDIEQFIASLPLESRELFYNQFDTSCLAYMGPQDWIDYQMCRKTPCFSHGDIRHKQL